MQGPGLVPCLPGITSRQYAGKSTFEEGLAQKLREKEKQCQIIVMHFMKNKEYSEVLLDYQTNDLILTPLCKEK